YLEGPKPDPQTGYWLLARTVVLTQGTPDGDRLAKYAWEQFWGAGGSEQGWKDYLAVAAAGAPKVRTEQAVEVAQAKPLAPDLAKAQAAGATSASASPPQTQTGAEPAQSASASASSIENSATGTAAPTPTRNPSDTQLASAGSSSNKNSAAQSVPPTPV